MATPRKRLVLVAALVAAVMPSTMPTSAGPKIVDAQPVQSCASPNETKTLFANELPGGKVGYGTAPDRIRIPGPTLEITEGDCLQVDLQNLTKRPVSIHAHGVKYTFESDGTPMNKGCVMPGKSGSFVFSAPAPGPTADGTVSQGSAGYWNYHDHCRGTPHGTAGVSKGLYGALIVRKPTDPQPDRNPFVVVMNDISINNKLAPKTPIFHANQGERIEFVVITHGENFHTFHLHGHTWFDNRTGMSTDPNESTPLIDTKTVGPAESFGFQAIAGQSVGPGAWMYHCHVQSHSDGGMSGLLVVHTAGGEMTAQSKRAVRRWKEQHGGGQHG